MLKSNDLPADPKRGSVTFYVGDDDYDLYTEWSTVWEPSPEDETIKCFVKRRKKDEKDYVNFKSLMRHLNKIAPHIRWRINTEGYDEYTTGYWQWETIAVPDDQIRDAEFVIEKIQNANDISQFSDPKDFFPSLYDKKGTLHSDVTNFTKAISDLRNFIYEDYSHYWDAPEFQIKSLIVILANLYASGARLALLKIDSYFNDDWLDISDGVIIGRAFTEEMWSKYGKYLDQEDYDEENSPFALMIDICDELDRGIEEFKSNEPYRVAPAIKYWQFGFKGTVGWGATNIDVLQDLRVLQDRIGLPKYEKLK